MYNQWKPPPRGQGRGATATPGFASGDAAEYGSGAPEGGTKSAQELKDVPAGPAWHGLAWTLRGVLLCALIVGIVQAGLRAQASLDLPNTRSGTFTIGGGSDLPYANALPALGLVVCPLLSSGAVHVSDALSSTGPDNPVKAFLDAAQQSQAVAAAGRRALTVAPPPPRPPPPTPTASALPPSPTSLTTSDYHVSDTSVGGVQISHFFKFATLDELSVLYGGSCSDQSNAAFSNPPGLAAAAGGPCVEVTFQLQVFGPQHFLRPEIFASANTPNANAYSSIAFVNAFAAITRPILNITGGASATAGPQYVSYVPSYSASNPWSVADISGIGPYPTAAFTGSLFANGYCPLIYYNVMLNVTVTPNVAAMIDPDFGTANLEYRAQLLQSISAVNLAAQGLCNTSTTFYCPTSIVANYTLPYLKSTQQIFTPSSTEFLLSLDPGPVPSPPLTPGVSSDVSAPISRAAPVVVSSAAPWVTGFVTVTPTVPVTTSSFTLSVFQVAAAVLIELCHYLECPNPDGSGMIRPSYYITANGLTGFLDVYFFLSRFFTVNVSDVSSATSCSSVQVQYSIAVQAATHLTQFNQSAIINALGLLTLQGTVNGHYPFISKMQTLALGSTVQGLQPGSCAQITSNAADAVFFTTSLTQAGDGGYAAATASPLFGFLSDISGCTHISIPSGNDLFSPAYASTFIDPREALPFSSEVAANASLTPSPVIVNVSAAAGSTLLMGLYPLDQGLSSVGSFMTVRTDQAGLVIFPRISASLRLKLTKPDGSDMNMAKALYSNMFKDHSLYTPEWMLDLSEGSSIGTAYVSKPVQVGRPGGVSFLLDLQPYFVTWTVPFTADVFSYGAADAIVASLTYFNTCLLLASVLVPSLLVHWHRKSRDVVHAQMMGDKEGAASAWESVRFDHRELALRNKLEDLEAALAKVEGLFENKSDAWLHQAEMRRLLGIQPQPPKVAPKEEATPYATPATGKGRTPAGSVQMTPQPGTALWKCALPSCQIANQRMYVECPKCGTKYCGEKHRQEHWTKGHAATCRLGMKR